MVYPQEKKWPWRRHGGEKRKKTDLMQCKIITYWNAMAGNPPYFEKKYPDLKLIYFSDTQLYFYSTLRKDIKTPKDMIGKRVAVGPGNHEDMGRLILGTMWGVWDKIKITRMLYGEATRALADGTIDVIYDFISNAGPGKFTPSPAMQEMMLTKDLYHLEITEEDLKKGRQQTGWPLARDVIPAGSLGRKQPDPISGLVLDSVYLAYTEMDENIVYEVAKTVVENWDKFGSYHALGKALTPETVSRFTIKSENEVHTGALKYYKEKGMKVIR
jgi:TRAP transporter TAXI family solute receptor